MKARFAKVLLLVFGSAVAVILLGVFLNREPEHRGRKLSDWFGQYYRSGQGSQFPNEPRHEQAARALRAIGTNAVPFLVAECFTENQDSPFKTNVLRTLGTLPEPIRFPPFVSAMAVREEAAQAIGEIRPPASLLLPLVTNWLNDPNRFHRRMATYLLGYVGEGGEAAVPFLVQKLSSAELKELSLATQGLDRLGTTARPAMPYLIEFIRTNDSRFRYYPSRTLARLGPVASNAIPVLGTAFAGETNPLARAQLAVALICIDSTQAQAMNYLASELSKTNATRHAFLAARDIGTNARPMLPLVLDACKNSDLWYAALYALLGFGETNLAISTAEEKLRLDDHATRFNAMIFLLRVQPTNSIALSNLVIELNELAWGNLAIAEAARLGVLAQPMIPRLREIVASKSNPSRDAARIALEVIEADMAAERDVR